MDQETWKNVTAGKVWVRKTDRRGELKDELVRGGGLLKITTDDRMYNQERAASAELDNFKNGRLVPVKILDTAEDVAEIAANPNLMSESDMSAALKGNYKALEKKLKDITNEVTLQRMLDIAVSEDLSLSKIQLVQSRINDVSGSGVVEVVSSGEGDDGSGSGFPAISL